MTETPDELGAALAAARAQADDLRRQLEAARADTDGRLVRAELKAEAVRAGMVDLDGLKLLDFADARLTAGGEVEGARDLIASFRRAKPWLFAVPASSASAAQPPRPEPPRAKPALAMTDAEYRAARAALLRRR